MQISGHKTASMLWRYNITYTRDIKNAGKQTERYLEEQKKAQKKLGESQPTELPKEPFDSNSRNGARGGT